MCFLSTTFPNAPEPAPSPPFPAPPTLYFLTSCLYSSRNNSCLDLKHFQAANDNFGLTNPLASHQKTTLRPNKPEKKGFSSSSAFFFFHGSLFVIGKSGVSKKTPGVIFDINYSTISVRPSIYQILSPILTFFRACLHGNGGRQVGEVTRLGGVTPCPYNLLY